MFNRSVNKVILIGNLGKDPELRYTAAGSPVANVSIATSESWKDKTTGERKEKSEWHRLAFFSRYAELVASHVRKGDKVYVEGKLVTNSYEKDGVTHNRVEIVCNHIEVLSSDGGSKQPVAPQQAQTTQVGNQQGAYQNPHTIAQAKGNVAVDLNDDIPF